MSTSPYAPLTPDTANAPLPPLAAGRPLLGHAVEMYRESILHMRDLYYRYGPIYRVRVPGREYTILAGRDANLMLSGTGDAYFTSRGQFSDFGAEMGTEHFMIELDGEEHNQLRRMERPGYSKQALIPHLNEVIAITRRHIASWPLGGRISVLDAMQRLVTEQIGTAILGHPPGDYFDDLRLFMVTVLRALVVGSWPRVMLKRPAYRRAKRRIFQLARDVTETYRHMPAEERPSRNLVAELLKYREAGHPLMDEDTLIASVVGAYLAGLDTVAGTLSFAIYAWLKHGVWGQVASAAADLFSEGVPSMSALRKADVLHAAVMEVLRMYPVAAFTPRLAAQSFTFYGYRVEKGSRLLIANTLTHFLPEFFPDPDTFDLERHLPPRKEYRQAGVFAPFTLGPHTCLGAGMAEVQLMTTLATIVHGAELALDPPDYRVRQALTPIPSPGFDFKVRLVRRETILPAPVG